MIVAIWQIVSSTHSVDYEVEKLPPNVRDAVEGGLQRFLMFKEQEMEYEIRRHRKTDVKWGFKAPVAMLLVPVVRHLAPRVKFLHVVRDGRDISFSGNQSPVEKFYKDHYGTDGDKGDPYFGKRGKDSARVMLEGY